MAKKSKLSSTLNEIKRDKYWDDSQFLELLLSALDVIDSDDTLGLTAARNLVDILDYAPTASELDARKS